MAWTAADRPAVASSPPCDSGRAIAPATHHPQRLTPARIRRRRKPFGLDRRRAWRVERAASAQPSRGRSQREAGRLPERTWQLAGIDLAETPPFVRQQRGGWRRDRQRLVRRVRRELHRPAVEADAARVRIEVRSDLAAVREVFAVAPPVVEDVRERVTRVLRGRDLRLVIAIAKTLPQPPISRLIARAARIAKLCMPRDSASLSRPRRSGARGSAGSTGDRCGSHCGRGSGRARGAALHTSRRAAMTCDAPTQHDVHGMARGELRPGAMRTAESLPRLLAAGLLARRAVLAPKNVAVRVARPRVLIRRRTMPVLHWGTKSHGSDIAARHAFDQLLPWTGKPR